MRDPHPARDRLRSVAAAIVGCAAQGVLLPLPAMMIVGPWPTLANPAIPVVCGLAALFVLSESRTVWTVNSQALDGRVASVGVHMLAGSAASIQAITPAAGLARAIDRRYRRLSAVSGLSLLLLLWLGIGDRAWNGSSPFISILIGGLMMLSGMALRVAAIRSLGRFFGNRASVVEDQILHIEGIHRWIRHPSEAGLLLFAGGTCLALASEMATLVALLLLSPSVWLRLRCEDDALCRAFGQPFVDYRRRVPALVPRVWNSAQLNLSRQVPA